MHDPASVQRLFVATVGLAADQRVAFLAAQCAGQPALQREVEALLGADADASWFGEAKLAALRARFDPAGAPLPERIGAFRIVAELGRGGMGVVYRARQDQPSREVALKVLAPGSVGPAARARLAMEAEALGRLQHPGIAQILESGTYRAEHAELPYLVMELVHGEPLHVWVDRHRPDRNTRLGVFLGICDAVHHAHQKGILHRDLKPGNVFVDTHGRAKVLDFGIARLLDSGALPSLHTHTGQLLGTLAYMSPEQATGSHERIDVRSDVYSLGVVAFQLLSGQLPFAVDGAPLTEALRCITDQAAPPLSRHDRRLAGDLERIVAMALRKEPERRYASVQALADDVRRHLAHQPVLARPATAAYVVSRFARRHQGMVAGAALALLALVVGTVVSVGWALRAEVAAGRALQAEGVARGAETTAREEAMLANRVLQFVEGLFAAAAPAMAGGREVTVRSIVEEGAQTIDGVLAAEPLVHARLSLFLGQVLTDLGDGQQALPRNEAALATLRRELPADDPRVVQALLGKARSLYALRDVAAAQPLFAEALSLHQGAGRPADETVARCHEGLGACAIDRGDAPLALQHYLTMQQLRAANPSADVRAGDFVRVANAHHALGEFAKAEECFAAAHTLSQGGDNLLLRATVATNLGALRAGQERWTEAETLFLEALELGERLLGREHPLLVGRLCNLAGVLSATGQIEAAEPLLVRALALGERGGQQMDHTVANTAMNLGNVRAAQDRPKEALELYERAATIYLGQQGPKGPDLADAYENMATAHERLGDVAKAAALREQAAAILR